MFINRIRQFAKVNLSRHSAERFFGIVLVCTLGTTMYFLIATLLSNPPWPNSQSHYSDSKALFAILIFLTSCMFWSVLWLTPNFLSLSQQGREFVRTFIDFLWYPAGIFAAILALGSATTQVESNLSANLQAMQRSAVDNTNRIFFQLDDACAEYQNKSIFYDTYFSANLAISQDDEYGFGPYKSLPVFPFVRDFCAQLPKHDRRRYSPAPIDYTHITTPYGLPNSCLDHSDFFNAQQIRMKLSKTSYYRGGYSSGFVATKGAPLPQHMKPVLLQPILHFCVEVQAVTKSIKMTNDFRIAQLTRDFLPQNPWVWIILLCSFAGLKISKSAIEAHRVLTKK